MANLQNHDVFRYHALGKSGLKLWLVLLKHMRPLKINEIIQESNLSKTTVYNKLRNMQTCGMVKCDGELWEAVKGVDLKKAAQILGTAGYGMRQKDKHRRERAAYKLKRESYMHHGLVN